MILLRDLQPGEKIFEKKLSETLQIGRTPIREALLILEQEKLAENHRGLGFVVRRLSQEEIEDYYNVRQLLEGYAAPLIIKNITEAGIQLLENNVAEVKVHLSRDDYRQNVLASSEFHTILVQMAKAPILLRALSSLDDIAILLRAMASRRKEGMIKSLNGHEEVVNAVKSGDAEQLKRSLVDHLNESKHVNLAIFELIS